jgi:hypothetical protein
VLINEDSRGADFPGFDLDELEMDPSERRPGGPVAEAVLALPQPALYGKCLIPLASFAAASLFQSIALYSATQPYAKWILGIDGSLASSHVLHNVTDKYTIASRLDKLKLPDNFIGTESATEPSWFQGLVPLAMPGLWLFVVIQSKNWRLWARTLFVGTLLALIKVILVWNTTLPDPAGWAHCKSRLDLGRLLFTKGEEVQGGSAFFDVLRIWLFSPKGLVCGEGLMSHDTCNNSLFALALYDAGRMRTRKLKPHFRWFYRFCGGAVLSIVVVSGSMSELAAGHRYTVDVFLAIIFTLLLYGNSTIALCVDRFLTCGSETFSLAEQKAKDPYDEGDVVVPMCCIPFCCLHGRYFLYRTSGTEGEAELSKQEHLEKKVSQGLQKSAAEKAEQFRIAEEQAARRLLELEAKFDAERQRTRMRDVEEKQEIHERFERYSSQEKEKSDICIAKELALLEAQVHTARQAREAEDRASHEKQELDKKEPGFDGELQKLKARVEASARGAQCKRAELAGLQDQLAQIKEQLMSADVQISLEVPGQ